MEDQIAQWKASTWQIRPALNMPSLDPEAVQFAVLESDPIEKFRGLLKRKKESAAVRPKQQEGLPSDLVQRAERAGFWDMLFQNTSGDQVSLLVPTTSPKDPTKLRTIVVSSNGPSGQKWLTSKATWLEGKPVCWCIPVDTQIGKEIRVELHRGNMIDLDVLAGTI